MTVSARDVAAVLREHMPDLGVTKQHKLLYYCQGHHLAACGEPLFHETISAWDLGPVVGTLWHAENFRTDGPNVRAHLDEAQLNTIGYVISRYGNLTARDLINLTHSEDPWIKANVKRRPGERVRIELEWIKEYFAGAGAAGDEDDEAVLDSDAVNSWLADAEARRALPTRPDSREEILARLRPRA